ncbi:hypothetical protein KGM_215307 [Danaus plexippus plexippus]|uniref:Uncharacterized protein n=1 Tax=Danaus plexippus plexippus TaxID=278856 RepID=A0A212F6A9_DANPL|nr:O-acyltransferase like protein-like [Danaus plexippus plexippus]OWR49275.1 hypothetical protein KGM_215307 [Danaus plexippus plexippus]
MYRVLIFLVFTAHVFGVTPEPDTRESAREEKLRSALIDAFQNIKKASGKGGLDDDLASDLIGSRIAVPHLTKTEKTTADSFDLFADDDGLTFSEVFGDVETEKRVSSTEKSHNVQHIVKTTKPMEITTIKPNAVVKTTIPVRHVVETVEPKIQPAGLNDTVMLGLESMLRILDSEILMQQWDKLKNSVTGDCRKNLQEYVQGLQERRLWALKMEDSSGRYTSMFYWGNNYWTGSAELCSILNQHHSTQHAHTTQNSSGSQIFSEWRQDVSVTGDGPPFSTAFFNVRMTVSTDVAEIIKTKRTLHLGLCLPRTCSREQVRQLVDNVRAPLLRHKVVAVRSPQLGGYSYIEDPTFQILLGVSCVVGALLIAATAYDMKIASDVRARRRRVNNMAAAESGHADLRLNMNGLDAITVSKGKSMYNVNNNIAINTNNSEERLTAETASTDEELKLSIWSELLLSFSMKANILQIFDQSVGSDTVPVVHGLRTFSMLWIIFGHTCIVVFKYADNTALRAVLEKSFWFQLILSAVYSVDTFFCLGGLLFSFLYFRTNAKGKLERLTKGRPKITAGLFQFLGLIGYRFARLTAPYLFMLGVVEVTMKWFAYNAVFEPPAHDHETCPSYWWRNVLYINTLFPVEQMCMLWSWYLSDDTQFYAVSAVLLILATSHFKLSAILTSVFFVSSLFTTGYVSYSSQHVPNGEDPFTQFDKIYDKPWTRLGPYLVGIATGWILFKTNLKINMSRVWWCVGWAVCAGVLLSLVFGLHGARLAGVTAAVFSALSHSLWAACVGWVIIACSTGHGGWVRPLLSSPVLYPFSRVTYCAYLVHPVVLRYVAMHLTHPIHLGELLVFVLFLGLAVISFFLAFVISVAFEAPIVTMLKIVSPQKKPHRV